MFIVIDLNLSANGAWNASSWAPIDTIHKGMYIYSTRFVDHHNVPQNKFTGYFRWDWIFENERIIRAFYRGTIMTVYFEVSAVCTLFALYSIVQLYNTFCIKRIVRLYDMCTEVVHHSVGSPARHSSVARTENLWNPRNCTYIVNIIIINIKSIIIIIIFIIIIITIITITINIMIFTIIIVIM